MTNEIPEASLHLEVMPTNPPRPSGFVARVNGRTICVFTLTNVEDAWLEYEKYLPYEEAT